MWIKIIHYAYQRVYYLITKSNKNSGGEILRNFFIFLKFFVWVQKGETDEGNLPPLGVNADHPPTY